MIRLSLLALLLAAPLAAQSVDGEAARPRVERIRFEGTDALSPGELRASIATRATRCKSVVFTPFCWITDSGTFVEKHYLDRAELERDELRLRVLYFQRGFREARLSSATTPRGRGVALTFAVDEGLPTRTRTLSVRQAEPVLGERAIRDAGLPREGEPLDLPQLDSAKLRLRSQLWEEGFGDAVVRDTVRVSEDLRGADVEVVLEPGRRTTIDTVVVRGNERVSERTIRRSLGLQPGAVYRRSDLLASQRRLYESNLFRQAVITVREGADTAKRVEVTVREAPLRAVRTGVGFNTVDFVQTEARFTRYNWLGGARRLDLRAVVGNLLAPQLLGVGPFGSAVPEGISGEVDPAYLRPTWQGGAEVVQPWFLSTRNSLGAGVFAHRRSVPGIVIDRGYGANTSFTRRLAEGIPASATYRFEVTTVEAGDVYYCLNYGVCDRFTIDALRGSQRLSPLGLSVFADRADDPLFPRTGWTARLDTEHASGATASDFRYNRASADAVRYLGVGRGVLAGRVRAGWVRPLASTGAATGAGVTQDGDGILHPRKRFYAGGARSVRGFGENQLGPRILTVAPEALQPDSVGGFEACTAPGVASASCDLGRLSSRFFQPRPLGGTRILEANLEYRFPLRGPLGGAVFVDGATIGEEGINPLASGRTAVTPGFGVRYASPVGPVRIDLGIRRSGVEELPVVTQTTDAGGFNQIVPLAVRKRYDPLEGTGFLAQVTNRLQLHLSIGEAF